MSAYHQMGHDSRNLLSDDHLTSYKGAILSPVNYEEAQVRDIAEEFGSDDFELIFDPQLYYPNSARETLINWAHFPADVDTGDLRALTWWQDTNRKLVTTIERFRPHSVCSPAVVPRVYSESYYSLNREIADDLESRLEKTDIGVLQTVLVRLEDLSDESKTGEIASIISGGTCERVFLAFLSEVNPRRELKETEDLKGAMRLIQYFEASGIRTLVGFSSSDIVLWKTAGATDCASGKFFNLRRFTPSRFEPPEGGGGQMSYWFEESLLGYLRESDLVRVRQANLLSLESERNPCGLAILDRMQESPGVSWLAMSWRQYLYWFANFEARFRRGEVDPKILLKNADSNWKTLDDQDVFMEERANDGSWVRIWRRCVVEAFKRKSGDGDRPQE